MMPMVSPDFMSRFISVSYTHLDVYKRQEKENEDSMTEPCFGDLELQNLSFSYEKDKAVLSDVNISFPKGSKTVLILSLIHIYYACK